MLEKLEELIGKICSDTSVAKADFQQGYGYGYSFSNYNTDFFTAWEMSGYYRFSWSERRPSRRFTMDTRNETLASYVLITQVGALRRARLRQRPIVIPGDAPSPQQWTITDTRWPRVKRYTSAADPTMVVESVNSLELRQTLFATQFPLEDYLESFMDPDANPVLSPYLSSVEPHLERLRDAGVKLPSDADYVEGTR